MTTRRRPVVLLALAALCGAALAQEPPAAPDEWSVVAPLASRSLATDGASAGGLMAVVGERGHVLISSDGGRAWRQERVPSRVLLTGVYLLDANHGWAVGHDAIILRTRDGGRNWERVHAAPEEERPLLDVWFRDESYGFAIGAYGFFLVSEDGGATWTPRDIDVRRPGGEEGDEGINPHLNAVARSATGRLYIAGESGSVFRSDDDGETWIALPSPYEGSFFGVLPLDGDDVLVFGLRGHLFRSEDAGRSWTALPTGVTTMLTDGRRLRDGTVVVTGLAGTLLLSRDGGRSFSLIQREDREGLSTILESGDGGLVLVGDKGVLRLDSRDAFGPASPGGAP